MSLLNSKQHAMYEEYKRLVLAGEWARDAITSVAQTFDVSKDQVRAVILTQEDHT